MKKKHFILPAVLVLLLVASVAWGYEQLNVKENYEVALDNHYQRLFLDVKEHVENVQVDISKALVATTKDRNIVLFTDIMNNANSAQDKLGQMPINHNDISKTQKFLTQASDYSYFLIQKHLKGQDITPEQRKNLTDLQENASAFNGELAAIQESMSDPDYVYGVAYINEMDKGEDSTADESAFHTSLVDFESNVSKSPELLYDGPFADQMLNGKAKGLEDKDVNEKQAANIALDFLGKGKVEDIESFEQGEGVDKLRIPTNTFHAYMDGKNEGSASYISVSKKGGKVIWMTNPRPIGDKKLSQKEAQKKALKFLEEKGFKNMEPNYSLKYDGYTLFNFAAKEGDVTIYPDLVKVKVALDTGEIIGMDAALYYLAHHKRDIKEPEISIEEARKTLKSKFDINSERLAIIPKGKDEVLTYEFKGRYGDGDFIIYINAQNGDEEQILQIIKSENGTLTF